MSTRPPAAPATDELRCALTGRALTAEEAHWAPPLITAGALVSTIARTLRTSPASLGSVLAADLPDVPYAPEARPLLARRRSVEQAKVLGLLLLIAILLVVPLVLLLR